MGELLQVTKLHITEFPLLHMLGNMNHKENGLCEEHDDQGTRLTRPGGRHRSAGVKSESGEGTQENQEPPEHNG